MSATAIIQLMERLIELHEELIETAQKKVDLIKTGDMRSLETLVREESKLTRKLETTELLRQKVVRTFLLEKGEVTENATISDVKLFVTDVEKETLVQVQMKLVSLVEKLREQNNLNQSLIEESLRFVNLSLDLLRPHKEDISYHPNSKEDEPYDTGHSIFDSKA
ncbi:flagellar protein [Halalkalibacter wakoensis JCM 9140]|uniref:Flagellar protein n=1 Tax=Halalkalibacter wakoensis JCM 9140 TaxID=1236970 RepID=W4Q3I9_9BACI|nr:flagellar protein FlgN [Halalkalibacter wakoensis]GAE26510.1 flagellar protein [Halalkalibacter wakoensis JCM 9140]